MLFRGNDELSVAHGELAGDFHVNKQTPLLKGRELQWALRWSKFKSGTKYTHLIVKNVLLETCGEDETSRMT